MPGVAVQVMAVPAVGRGVTIGSAVRGLVKLRDKHWRDILQAIRGLHAGKMPAMTDEFIRHLIDDERRAVMRGQGLEGVAQQLALFSGSKMLNGIPETM